MSYDIKITEEKFSSNYTSNIQPILHKAFLKLQNENKAPTYYRKWFEPMVETWDVNKGREYLKNLINEVKFNPDTYKPLEPPIDEATGERWGTYEGCIEWLEEILLAWVGDYRIEIDY